MRLRIRAWLGLLDRSIQDPTGDPDIEIPPEIRSRLIDDNTDRPLWPVVAKFGRGLPGITRQDELWWIVRDVRGRVAGGLRAAPVGPDHPPALDIAVDPQRRRQGWASALYRAAAADGIDIEGGSAASLAHRAMTPLGFSFMLGRRLRSDPDALIHIAATVDVCPSCGPQP